MIPFFNSGSDVDKYLPPVVRMARRFGAEVIAVDDCSTDDTLERLRRHPAVRVIALDANLGFPGAANSGMQAASTAYALLLNSDVLVHDDLLGPLLNVLESSSDAFAAVPRVQTAAAPTRCQSDVALELRHGFIQIRERQRPVSDAVTPVAYPTGACALIDLERFHLLGGFDTIFRPAYEEDVDLGYRAWGAGWSTLLVNHIAVVHEDGASMAHPAARNARTEVNTWRNKHLFAWKNFHSRQTLMLYALWLVPNVLRALAHRQPGLVLGLLAAIRRRSEARASRHRAAGHRSVSDGAILSRAV